jgi:hypothetical protein
MLVALVVPVFNLVFQSYLCLSLHCRILPGSLVQAATPVGADVKAVKSIGLIPPLLASNCHLARLQLQFFANHASSDIPPRHGVFVFISPFWANLYFRLMVFTP